MILLESSGRVGDLTCTFRAIQADGGGVTIVAEWDPCAPPDLALPPEEIEQYKTLRDNFCRTLCSDLGVQVLLGSRI